MEDIIFERDYHEEHEKNRDSRECQILNQALNGGFFKNYSDAMDAIPKVIVPEDKANYEYLLKRCDEMAHRLGGKIRGIVDYHKWSSKIDVNLPYFEFGSEDELEFMKEISGKAHYVLFEPNKDGGIRLHIMVNYFQELMTDEHQDYLKWEAVMKDETLANMLGMSTEVSAELEEYLNKMNDLLSEFEATGLDRTSAFKLMLNRVTLKEDEEQTLEALLEVGEEILSERS